MNITCSALPEPLLESELFGHERGAFTDARMQKRGLFERADGGTVFLDEIGEMVPALQAKLLRFLEEKTFKRVGGAGDIRVDVRVVAATNRNLEEQVAKGAFRRICTTASTCCRSAAAAARTCRRRAGSRELLHRSLQRGVPEEDHGREPAAAALLKAYGWPGNVRELRNAVERAMLLAEGPRLEAHDFSALKPGLTSEDPFDLPADGINLEELERSLVVQALGGRAATRRRRRRCSASTAIRSAIASRSSACR